MSELKPEQNISVEIVSGIEGLCLLVNDYRVAGPKPWGGGKVVHSFQAKQSQIDIALRRAQPANEPLTLEELLEMDGEPVWIQPLDGSGCGEWAIVGIGQQSEPIKVYGFDSAYAEFSYGKTWLAYRRKPEGSENE